MAEIRYIHAADLHLDAPFAGISRDSSDSGLAKLFNEASFIALERLARLCESKNPHFLVLAGDIYNSELAGIKAQLKLRDVCKRLDDLGIPVYIAHGNHDPLPAQLQSLRFPPNVHVFSAESPEIVEFNHGGVRAVIHGLSHGRPCEERNLALMFQRKADDNAFQLGVLHCSVENADPGDRYAPCKLGDLKKSGLDAWALGHVHEAKVLSSEPFIAYPGSSQGLNINETGSKGCLVVTAREEDGVWRCASEFHTLGPVQWRNLTLSMDKAADREELESRLARLMDEELEQADPAALALLNRLTITGRTPLNSWLRQEDRAADIREIMAESGSGRPAVRLNHLETLTSDELTWEQSMARDDLLGQTIRVYKKLSEDPSRLKDVFDHAMEPLLKRPLLSGIFQKAGEAELKETLYQAESLCMDALENNSLENN